MVKNPKTDESYQELRAKLDAVIEQIQAPNVGIDDAVGYYEQALKLIAQLEKHLQTAENRILEIKAGFDKPGSPKGK